MNHDKAVKSFERCGHKVSCFSSREDAARYLADSIRDASVGFGDSKTLADMNLAEKLSQHNLVNDPGTCSDDAFRETARRTLNTDVYVTSVNGAAETGELVNLDGAGNRVAGSLYGHDAVYFVFGTNKLRPTLDEAIWRCRNVAAPQNARRLGCRTPCAVKADKCYDCQSPDRICNGLAIHLRAMSGVRSEIILIDEDLGL